MMTITASNAMVLKCAAWFIFIVFWIRLAIELWGHPREQDSIPWSQRLESLRHNFELFTTDRNTSTVVGTTIGWRPDPINKEDGYIEVKGKTSSGVPEYKRLIRLGKRK